MPTEESSRPGSPGGAGGEDELDPEDPDLALALRLSIESQRGSEPEPEPVTPGAESSGGRRGEEGEEEEEEEGGRWADGRAGCSLSVGGGDGSPGSRPSSSADDGEERPEGAASPDLELGIMPYEGGGVPPMIGGQVDPPERVDRRHERHLEALGLPPGGAPPAEATGRGGDP